MTHCYYIDGSDLISVYIALSTVHINHVIHEINCLHKIIITK